MGNKLTKAQKDIITTFCRKECLRLHIYETGTVQIQRWSDKTCMIYKDPKGRRFYLSGEESHANCTLTEALKLAAKQLY